MIVSAALAVMAGVGLSAQPARSPAKPIELLRDPGFTEGVRVATRSNYPPDLQAKARKRWQERLPSTGHAAWEFIEISETQNFSANPDTPTVDGARITYASRDYSKRFEIDRATGQIRYVLDTTREWRHGCNLSLPQDGVEPRFCRGKAWNWPHFLVWQRLHDPAAPAKPLPLDSYARLVYSFRAELQSSSMGKPNPCPPGTWGAQNVPNHCLFYVAFVMVRKTTGASATAGAGAKQASLIFALRPVFYSWNGKTHTNSGAWLGLDPAGHGVYFTPNPVGLVIGQPAHITIDAQSLAAEAAAAVGRRLHVALSAKDYTLNEVLMGWEVWGPFRSDLLLGNLSFLAYPR